MQPLVSVIIPCYRQGHLLPQAIESVFAQTYARVEAVVVNDGSDDSTEAVSRGYGDRIVYVAQPNGGLSAARNTGLAQAAGQYVLFLDADDRLAPTAVERMLAALQAAPADAFAAIGYRRFVRDLADAEPEVPAPAADRLFPRIFAVCHPIHAHLLPIGLVRRAGGFSPGWPANEDLDFWLRLGRLHPVVVPVRGVGAYYRRNPAAMNADRERIVRTGTEVLLAFADSVIDDPGFLTRHGEHLLLALYAYRRRLLARGGRPELETRLTAAVLGLRGRGVRVTAPFTRKVFDGLPAGLQTLLDRAVVGGLRLVRPSLAAEVRGDVQAG
jgi:glycosyltransferase involved in cell wall biosynthesis